jgi:hypothetical protein
MTALMLASQLVEQPQGWFGPKVALDWPRVYNLRLDPFERCYLTECPGYMMDFWAREMWRFVFAQQKVATLGETAVEFPPMQASASFNLSRVTEIQEAIKKAHGGVSGN